MKKGFREEETWFGVSADDIIELLVVMVIIGILTAILSAFL